MNLADIERWSFIIRGGSGCSELDVVTSAEPLDPELYARPEWWVVELAIGWMAVRLTT